MREKITQRWEWHQALTRMHAIGRLKPGEVALGHALAEEIYWNPSDHRQSGLYIQKEKACEIVGLGRASYYRHKGGLERAGLLRKAGNGAWIASLPDDLEEISREYEARKSRILERDDGQSSVRPHASDDGARQEARCALDKAWSMPKSIALPLYVLAIDALAGLFPVVTLAPSPVACLDADDVWSMAAQQTDWAENAPEPWD